MAVRRPLWWRLAGILTVLVALSTANLVWHVNRHVSRMELARIFATAMTNPRAGQAESRPPSRRSPRGVKRPKPAPPAMGSKTKSPRPTTANAAAMDQADQFRQTQISELTRQTWALVSLVLLECVVMAGLSALLDTRRARRHLLMAGLMMIAGTALTAIAGMVITRWGGFPPLMGRDYLRVAARGGSFGIVLVILLALPSSRRYGRALRWQVDCGHVIPWLAHPVSCGVLTVLTACLCAGSAIAGGYLSLPAWHLIRWGLIGWSMPAAASGLIVCTGWRGGVVVAYVLGIVGVIVQLACWGLPFVVVGPPAALVVLLIVLPPHLIGLGRLRECLAATSPRTEER